MTFQFIKNLLNASTSPNALTTSALGDILCAEVQHLLYDTRRITFTENALFVALQSAQNDGHRYLAAAYKAGVRSFLVCETAVLPKNWDEIAADALTLVVPNTLVALQQIAAQHRSNFPDLRTIGITGSNGKTIVKEWLYQVLHTDETIVRSPKSYNSQLGVPLSVWQIQAEHTLGIFEAGISEIGEMANLAQIIQPNIGVFTNLGTAHSAGFTDNFAKAMEKLDLFTDCEVLIYSRDYPQLERAVQAKFPNKRKFTWTTKEDVEADIYWLNTRTEISKSAVTNKYESLQTVDYRYTKTDGTIEIANFELPFVDTASTENALCCCAVMRYLGYDAATTRGRIAGLESVELRLQLNEAINNCTLINDAYNADLNSLDIALTFAKQQQRKATITLVLSDILETGKTVESLYKSVAVILRQHDIKTVIGVGTDILKLVDYLPQGSRFFHFYTTNDFLHSFKNNESISNKAEVINIEKPIVNKNVNNFGNKLNNDFDNNAPTSLQNIFQKTTILLKAARVFEFERIAAVLAQKQHRTTLAVNMSALSHNLRVYKQYLKPETLLMVMVKAAAYGSGSEQVARLLSLEKVDYLAVAYTDEGYELRQSGIALPIMVMNVEADSFDALIRYRLEPELYSRSTFEGFLATTAAHNLAEAYPVHLKLDTGMHRLGFEYADLEWLCSVLKTQKNLYIASVFTHLAATDNPAHDEFTHQQAARFSEMYATISDALGYAPRRHILNSGGINRFAAQYQMDMVRLGIGLYGIDGSNEIQEKLQTVMTLNATISQIKTIAVGDSIGYNRMGKTTKPMRIATISLGYADGLSRRLSNGKGKLWLRGALAPIIGNVCMDMCMLDITHIANATEGDIVEVFGESLPVQTLAKNLDTIPYEVFTSVSGRVKRIYFQE
jgi:Alr-MurF fusion protein